MNIDDFVKSNEKQRIVSFKLPSKDKNNLCDYPEFFDIEIQCRLIKVEVPIGKVEVLCISLLDT
ncbi:MAG: hypothetical protein SNJ71_03575 [Bacteroidales bacterium]